MKNKYQEALNKLRFAVSIAQDLPYKECNELCDIIYELVKKETPMKPLKLSEGDFCRKCKCEIPENVEAKYCPNCGQKLDWSDEH